MKRLTKSVKRGLWELIPILDFLSTTGWEGTTLDNHYCGFEDKHPKKCDLCRQRNDAEEALAWLVSFANKKARKEADENP